MNREEALAIVKEYIKDDKLSFWYGGISHNEILIYEKQIPQNELFPDSLILNINRD